MRNRISIIFKWFWADCLSWELFICCFQCCRYLPREVDPLVYNMSIENSGDVTYSEIGGLAEQIRELREVSVFLQLVPNLFINCAHSWCLEKNWHWREFVKFCFYEGQVPCPVFEYCDFDVLKKNRQTKFNYMKVFLLQKHGPWSWKMIVGFICMRCAYILAVRYICNGRKQWRM